MGQNSLSVLVANHSTSKLVPLIPSQRRNIKQISLSMIKELQILLELSGRKTVQLISSLRKGLGSRTSIESNIFGQLHDLENSVSEFYNLEKVS